MKSSFLHEKEVIGANYEGEIKLGAYHDGLYIYVNNVDQVYAFNSINLSKITFEPPDKSIQSSVTAVALSPSHDYVVVGFLDGSIQSYEYPNPKPQKVISKSRGAVILSIAFIRENTIVFMDSTKNIFQYELSKSMKSLFAKDKHVCKLSSSGLSVVAPPVYRYRPPTQNSKQSCYSICPKFDSTFLVLLAEATKMLQVTEDISIINDFKEYSSAFVDFIIEDENTLKIAIFSNNKASLLRFTRGSTPEVLKSIDIEISPLQVAFLTESILSITYGDGMCKFVSFQDGSVTETTIPHNGFTISLEGSGGFVSFNDGKMYKYSLPSFIDKFDDIMNNDNFEEGKNLCAAAIKGDSYACIGLPTNYYQRELFVQTKFMEFFTNYMSSELFKAKDFDGLFNECVKTAIDMNSTEWITSKLLKILSDEDKLPIYFKKILSLDPDATKFFYTKEFFESLISNYNEPDIYSFIEKLDSSVATPALVIKHAIDHQKFDVAATYYINSLKDIVSALTVYYNSELYDRIVKIIDECVPENKGNFSIKIISWLFQYNKGQNKFERLPKLINKLGNDISYIKSIGIFIKKENLPFSYDIFFNSLIAIVSMEKLGYKHELFNYVVELFLEKEVKLSQMSLSFLLGSIFSSEYSTAKKREEILIKMIERKLLDNIGSEFMDLCDSFEYSTAKGLLMMKGKRYDTIISDMLKNSPDNVFDFMEKMLTQDSECSPSIKKAIETLTDQLMAIDIQKFFNFVAKFYPDIVPTIPTLAHENLLINAYIRLVYNDERTKETNFANEYKKSFVEFICNYYPDEVLPYIRNQDENLFMDFLTPIKENNILDTLVYIQFALGQTSDFAEQLMVFLGETIANTINEKIPNEITEKSTLFVSEMAKKLVAREASAPTTKELLSNLIKDTVIAIFVCYKMDQEKRSIKVVPFRRLLQSLSVISSNSIKFDELLKFLMTECGELELGDTRTTIMNVINDYQYDVDSDKTLGELFWNDMLKSYEDYITLNITGIQVHSAVCGTCKSRLSNANGYQIRIFPCGHCFHDNPQCLRNNQCPICQREEIYGETTANVKSHDSDQDRVIKRRINRFEYDIHALPTVGEIICDDSQVAQELVNLPTTNTVPTI